MKYYFLALSLIYCCEGLAQDSRRVLSLGVRTAMTTESYRLDSYPYDLEVDRSANDYVIQLEGYNFKTLPFPGNVGFTFSFLKFNTKDIAGNNISYESGAGLGFVNVRLLNIGNFHFFAGGRFSPHYVKVYVNEKYYYKMLTFISPSLEAAYFINNSLTLKGEVSYEDNFGNREGDIKRNQNQLIRGFFTLGFGI